MEEKNEVKTTDVQSTSCKGNAKLIKMGIVAMVSLLLLIPLHIVREIISERENTKNDVQREIAESYAGAQYVAAGKVYSTIVTKEARKSNAEQSKTEITWPAVMDYQATVDTDVLHRSIYDVIVYKSTIEMTGKIAVDSNLLVATKNMMELDVRDLKGLLSQPHVTLGGKQFPFERIENKLMAQLEFPEQIKEGDMVDFSISLKLKGTESLMFYPFAKQTTTSITSSYPHPSFQGDFSPESREVNKNGFNAKWNVLRMNTDSYYDTMGVKFVEPASPYQQATRSAKYGMLIICLTFIASMLIEYLTRKEINVIQYGVIGLSLVLFYALLVSFSEFIAFGAAYAIAAIMTIGALTFYYRAILKGKSAYLLASFIAVVYGINYILLQMEIYALLAGSLVLFAMLMAVMYITAEMKTDKRTNNQD